MTGRNIRPRPPAVEPHELGAVLVQDVAGHDPLFPAFRQHHDHPSTRTNIVDVMREVLELLGLKGPNHRPLKLREESMFDAGRIQAMEILVAVEDVDVLLVESGAE